MREEYICIIKSSFWINYADKNVVDAGPKRDEIVYVIDVAEICGIPAYALEGYTGYWQASAFVPAPKITEIEEILKQETI